MMRKITLLLLMFSIKIASAQKIPSLYYRGNHHIRNENTFIIISKTSDLVSVGFNNKWLTRLWRNKTPQQINITYRSKPNIKGFSYNNITGNVKLSAPLNFIKEILKKEFRFSEADLTAKGL